MGRLFKSGWHWDFISHPLDQVLILSQGGHADFKMCYFLCKQSLPSKRV